MNLSHKKGFTLIELLVVISIIGLLSSIVLMATKSAKDKATDAQVIANFRQVKTALELYRLDNNGNFPPDNGSSPYSITALQNHLVVDNKYIPSLPVPPAGADWSYMYSIVPLPTTPPANGAIACGNKPASGYYLLIQKNSNSTRTPPLPPLGYYLSGSPFVPDSNHFCITSD